MPYCVPKPELGNQRIHAPGKINMLPRVLETEVMDTSAEAVDYDARDHSEVNRIFVADLLAAGLRPEAGEILDLGAGTAQIPIELCRRAPAARVRATDAARHMIEVAQKNLSAAGLVDRIRLELVNAKRLPYADGQFTTVISNSLVHHIAEPSLTLAEAWRVLAPGGLIFFRDLFRPDDETMLGHLVATHSVGDNAHQRQMFAQSLLAALRIEEMQALVAELGVDPRSVRTTTDRHWTWAAWKE